MSFVREKPLNCKCYLLTLPKKVKALDQEITNSAFASASEMAGTFGKLTGATKAAFLAQKALAAAYIVVTSLTAQAAAVALPPIGLGPILGLALIPKLETLMAFQLAGVAAQTIQGFEFGGPGLRPPAYPGWRARKLGGRGVRFQPTGRFQLRRGWCSGSNAKGTYRRSFKLPSSLLAQLQLHRWGASGRCVGNSPSR